MHIYKLDYTNTFIDLKYGKLDEKIFSVKENINYLNGVKELGKLEHDYLSSPEKLLELSNLYFDLELN